MAGILNNTARQFNLKCLSKEGQRVVVRIAPGFNVVDDNHWSAFVPKDGKKVDPYVKNLKKIGSIDFGSKMDDLELERDPDTKAKSKSEPLVQMKASLEKAQSEAKDNENRATKSEAEAEKALAEAEKAKLELEKTKLELTELKKSQATKK